MITDFRLKVFETVARRLSFTRAAEELFITQPAVTRHIRELETQLDCRLFRRSGRSIALTPPGTLLLARARAILREYEELNSTLSAETGSDYAGELDLGASTTATQYVLPPVLALFNSRYPSISLKLINGNSDDIERAVAAETVHLGIIEGTARHPDLHYRPFLDDEIVLVTASPAVPADMQAADLPSLGIVMREEGSGTRRVVEHALAGRGIQPSSLTVPIQLGNTESIKLYLRHSSACAFLSRLAVAEELARRTLRIIHVRDLTIARSFRFAGVHGAKRKLAELFVNICMSYYNKM